MLPGTVAEQEDSVGVADALTSCSASSIAPPRSALPRRPHGNEPRTPRAPLARRCDTKLAGEPVDLEWSRTKHEE